MAVLVGAVGVYFAGYALVGFLVLDGDLDDFGQEAVDPLGQVLLDVGDELGLDQVVV